MVLVTVSSTVCMYAQTKDAVERRFPHDICMEFVSDDYGETQSYRDLTEDVLAEYGESAENVRTSISTRPQGLHWGISSGWISRLPAWGLVKWSPCAASI